MADLEVTWNDEALLRLEKVPEFVRPMAKEMIEAFVRDQGQSEVTPDMIDQARAKFGM